jgi:imidazolonepropionase-like amidohydrolase
MHALRAPVAFDGLQFLPDGATVLVDAGSIVGVEPLGYDVPADCPVTTYDGALLPGLFDAHVHLVSDAGMGSLERAGTMPEDEVDAVIAQSLRQQVAAGVTTVRDLGDTRFLTLPFRDRAEAGVPRIVAAGPPLTVPEGHCHYLGGAVADTDGIRSAVAEHVDRGVDVMKVMASGGMTTGGTDVFGVQFAPADLRLLVDLAHEADLQVLAHAHSLAGIRDALAAGVDGFEHFTGLTEGGVEVPDAVLEHVAKAGLTVDPTFGFDRVVMANMPGPPPRILEALKSTGMDLEALIAARRVVAGRMRAHGIRVVSGVDAGAVPTKAHGTIALAIADLLIAGFPIDEALASATSVAADACGLSALTGSLTPGLAADLLVVDGDLRTDPGALGRPVAVLVRGADPLG